MLRTTTNAVGSSSRVVALTRVGGRRTLVTTTTAIPSSRTKTRTRTRAPLAPPPNPTLATPTPKGLCRTFHASRVWESSGKKLETFNLADIGEGITECEVIKWSIQPGARIEAFDPLCEVQSDKASVEITSPFDGIVKELLVAEGDIAKVGAGLCIIEVDAEGGAAAATVPPSETAAATSSTEGVAGEGSAAETTSGQLSEEGEKKKKKLHPLDPSNATPRRLEDLRIGSHPSLSKGLFGAKKLGIDLDAAAAATASSASSSSSTPEVHNAPAATMGFVANAADVLATPAVRHFAKERGVDLARVAPGSGRDGRVELVDVEAYLKRASSAPQGQQVKKEAAAPKEQEGEVVVELGRTRYNMWKAMVKSLEIPHFGYSTTLDITELHNMLPTLNAHIPARYLPPAIAAQRQPFAIKLGMVDPHSILPNEEEVLPESMHYTKLTYLPILLKTLSKAMMEWPLLRSSITPTTPSSSSSPSSPTNTNPKPTLTIRPSADIALALSTPTGLYTPTLSSVHRSSIYALASSLKHLSHLGRQVPCALTPKEMPRRGGTLTVSNVGAVGAGDAASPVLVPGGGVAIVALGRAKWVWDVNRKAEGERRLVLPVSWSADHRVVEGAELAAFVECWRGYVEEPARLVAEGV